MMEVFVHSVLGRIGIKCLVSHSHQGKFSALGVDRGKIKSLQFVSPQRFVTSCLGAGLR